ncbi:hypothetical protein B0T17DRAFT_189156 [Bombardia bombarda]|uniref:2EXR domain-containing protein n=1 Tax=Bombardia bombarda TaxID=252184 RepID=A0AA39X997_9PEZI|nr:hypothetical protein B0T17DRAFT_189156 [Bombardia bombarda]
MQSLHPRTMPESFHFFPFLPRELRDEIWRFAVRPPGRGAHIFRLYSKEEAERTNPDRQYEIDSSARFHPFPAAAATQCLPPDAHFTLDARASAPISWTGHNPSAYLIDSGLWNACKESRQAIQKAFKLHKWLTLATELDKALYLPNAPARRWHSPWPESYQKAVKELLDSPFHMPATLLARDGSSDRYMTIFPVADLVTLQIEQRDLGNIPWDLQGTMASSQSWKPRTSSARAHMTLVMA